MTDVQGINRSSDELRWTPADFDAPTSPVDSLVVSSPAASAAIVREVLAGAAGPARDIVVVNAAAAVWTAGRAATTHDAARVARNAIDSGAARELLAKLVQMSNA